MRAVMFEVDGVINTGERLARLRDGAARRALIDAGIEVSDISFNDLVQHMRFARAIDPLEAALWQAFQPYALTQGWDVRERTRRFNRLKTDWRSRFGYAFDEREGIRALLEELKFQAVDMDGDVPLIVGVANDRNFAHNALDHAGLGGLFDHVVACDERHASLADPRVFESALASVGAPAARAIFVGVTPCGSIAAANAVGLTTIHFAAAPDSGFPARTIAEMPFATVDSVLLMGEEIMEWLNRPIRTPRSVRATVSATDASDLTLES